MEDYLVSRINELNFKLSIDLEKVALYGGIINLETSDTIPIEEFNPKNVQRGTCLKYLMSAYEEAIALKEVCEIYDMLHSSNKLSRRIPIEVIADFHKAINKTIDNGRYFIKRTLERDESSNFNNP